MLRRLKQEEPFFLTSYGKSKGILTFQRTLDSILDVAKLRKISLSSPTRSDARNVPENSVLQIGATKLREKQIRNAKRILRNLKTLRKPAMKTTRSTKIGTSESCKQLRLARSKHAQGRNEEPHPQKKQDAGKRENEIRIEQARAKMATN